MSVGNKCVSGRGDRATVLDRAAHAFGEICSGRDVPAIDGRAVGHRLPPRRIRVDELVELLPSLGPEGRDAVWRELVQLSRERGGPWPMIALGLALPGLRTAAAKLTRTWGGGSEDLDAELVAAFLEALAGAEVSGPNLCANLRTRAYNQVRRMRYGAIRYAVRNISLEQIPEQAISPSSSGHPELVLADAIRAGVINRREAELIGATRLEGRPVRAVAERLGVAITTAWCQRKSAEARLAAWIKDGKTSA